LSGEQAGDGGRLMLAKEPAKRFEVWRVYRHK